MDAEPGQDAHPFEVAHGLLNQKGEAAPLANGVSMPGDVQHHDAVINWLEEQVKCRLTALDDKIELLTTRVDCCLTVVTRLDKHEKPKAKPGVRVVPVAPELRPGRATRFVEIDDTPACVSRPLNGDHPLRFHAGASHASAPSPPAVPPPLLAGEGSQEGSEAANNRHGSKGSDDSTCPSAAINARARARFATEDVEDDPGGKSPKRDSLLSCHTLAASASSKHGVISPTQTHQTVATLQTEAFQSSTLDHFNEARKTRDQVTCKRQAGGRTAVTRDSESLANRLDLMNNLPTLFQRDRNMYIESAYNFLDDPESGIWASRYSRFTDAFLILSVVITLLQTTTPPTIGETEGMVFETIFDMVFLLEVLVRFCLSPSFKGFFCVPYNWIDMLAASPFVIRATLDDFKTPNFAIHGDSFERTLLLCIVPILRLLKMLRHFEKIHLLLSAFQQSLEALPVLLYILLMLTLVFSALIYIVEPRSNIDSYPQAIWLSIVTMTTVGYGDVTPQDPMGAVIVSILVIGSMLFMAMPLGIIGAAFTQVWAQRDVVLLMSRTRERLIKWGYTAHDIPLLFKMVDQDGDGELELEEFKLLIDQMKIGLDVERVIQLFGHFDEDKSGSIDAKEFVRHIFPTTYLEVYGKSDSGKEEDHNSLTPLPRLNSTRSTKEEEKLQDD